MEGEKRFYKTGRRETVLFNDALNTFYLWLYGRRETVLFNDALNIFTVIMWRQTYDKGPFTWFAVSD